MSSTDKVLAEINARLATRELNARLHAVSAEIARKARAEERASVKRARSRE